MSKLLLLITGLTLTLAAQAQVITDQVQLPGQGLGSRSPMAAAQTGAVSQLQEVLLQNYDAGAWVDFERQTYLHYRTPTLPGLIRSDRKNAASWVASTAHRYQYTTAGVIQSDTIDQYLQAPFGAYFASIGSFTTPSQVRREWQTTHIPGSPTAAWDSVRRHTHTYNSAGQRTQLLEELYQQEAFQLSARRLWTYNALGQIAVFEAQTPPNGGPNWGPLQRATYTYNAAGHVQQVTAEITNIGGTAYVNATRNSMQFDGQGRESVLTSDDWGNDNTWQLHSHTLYAYDAAGDLTSATLQLWNGSTFQNAQRLLFTYAQVLSARSATTGVRQLAVVPNPSSVDAPAQLLLEAGAASATGRVYDHLGRLVAALACPPAQVSRGFLPLPAGLPAGLYLVRLRAGARQWQARWDQR